MGFFGSIGGAIAKGLDFVSAVAVNPIKAVTHPIEATNQITQLRTSGTQAERMQYIKNVGVTTAINVGSAVVPAGKVLQAIKPAVTTFKGGALTLAIAPTVATALVQNPASIYSAPQKIFDFQTDAGSLISKETTKEDVWNFLKEHPYLTATTAVSALAVAGYTGSSLVGYITSYYNRKATEENTKAMQDTSTKPTAPPENPSSQGNYISQGSTPNIINIYQTPQPTTSAEIPISAPVGEQTQPKTKKKTTTKKKAKKKTKKKAPKKKKKTTKKRKVYK